MNIPFNFRIQSTLENDPNLVLRYLPSTFLVFGELSCWQNSSPVEQENRQLSWYVRVFYSVHIDPSLRAYWGLLHHYRLSNRRWIVSIKPLNELIIYPIVIIRGGLRGFSYLTGFLLPACAGTGSAGKTDVGFLHSLFVRRGSRAVRLFFELCKGLS